MTRHDDARSLLRAVYNTEVDINPDMEAKTLTIRLHPPANNSSDQAVRHLCDELNCTETVFPGTELRLIYIVHRNSLRSGGLKMDGAFASSDSLNREDNRRTQTRRVAGLGEGKRRRSISWHTGSGNFVVSDPPSVDGICGYSCYVIPEIPYCFPLTREHCHTIEPQKPGRRTEAFIPPRRSRPGNERGHRPRLQIRPKRLCV